MSYKVWQQITKIPVSNNQSRDIFTRGPDKNSFSKSAYNFLKKRNEVINSTMFVELSEESVWSKLWKIKTMHRHIRLMWRILPGKLPVKITRFKQGVNCQPICNLCDQYFESIDHLFIQCEWLKLLWFASQLGITTKFIHAPISYL